MTNEEKSRILRTLDERHLANLCPFCKKGRMMLIDGYVGDYINDDFNQHKMVGRYIPSIMLVCDHCGFQSKHALGALGLLDTNASNNDNKKKTE